MEIRTIEATDEASIRSALSAEGWAGPQIEGQLDAIERLAATEDGFVAVASESAFCGFISMQVYAWNRLAQIHGLAVDGQQRRRGIASALVGAAEDFARSRRARGVIVDTPVDNQGARCFYEANGFTEAYRMPRYYSDDLDGVTFVKFFD